jgi:hypothetical protein
VNPFGDEALELLGDWWSGTDCGSPDELDHRDPS